MNKLPFPKIDPKVFDREGLKECYIFKPKKGEKNCPTVIHFVLVNINFRKFKAPGECLRAWSFPQHVQEGKYAQSSRLYYYINAGLPSRHMRHLFLEVALWNMSMMAWKTWFLVSVGSPIWVTLNKSPFIITGVLCWEWCVGLSCVCVCGGGDAHRWSSSSVWVFCVLWAVPVSYGFSENQVPECKHVVHQQRHKDTLTTLSGLSAPHTSAVMSVNRHYVS